MKGIDGFKNGTFWVSDDESDESQYQPLDQLQTYRTRLIPLEFRRKQTQGSECVALWSQYSTEIVNLNHDLQDDQSHRFGISLEDELDFFQRKMTTIYEGLAYVAVTGTETEIEIETGIVIETSADLQLELEVVVGLFLEVLLDEQRVALSFPQLVSHILHLFGEDFSGPVLSSVVQPTLRFSSEELAFQPHRG